MGCIESLPYEVILRGSSFKECRDYIKKECDTEPKIHCIPIWSLYVTAYARLKLYSYLEHTDPIYCDTDSIITDVELEDSKELGFMKKEMDIDEMLIIRPKFYGIKYFKDGEIKEYVKSKGIPYVLKYHNLKTKVSRIDYNKFSKFRESVRKGIRPNKMIDVFKHINYDDDKRIFHRPFSVDNQSDSIPIVL